MLKHFPVHLFLSQVLVFSTLSTIGWPMEAIVICCGSLCFLYLGVMIE